MIVAARLPLLLGLLLGLSACALQQAQPVAGVQKPVKAHAHFAPPPDGPSHWDPQLQVYVLQNSPHLYYRQRTYYRWQQGWSWATQAAGPWQACGSDEIPAGLSRHYQ